MPTSTSASVPERSSANGVVAMNLLKREKAKISYRKKRIRAALNDIARARNMSRLARDAGMTREGLYKALSENGNPTLATVTRIARALGMRVRITV